MTGATYEQTRVRRLRSGDLPAVVELDALLTGAPKEDYWGRIFERFLREEGCIGLAATEPDGSDGAEGEPRFQGYLFGELRAFEFGSEPCGWIFAVGVHQDAMRSGVGSALLEEACRLFGRLGVEAVRTMVPRTDVPFLSFFRRHGFVGGPFVQLELSLAPGGNEVERPG
jgi:ribosomal protein S18 acetylase RimI-like enzyme